MDWPNQLVLPSGLITITPFSFCSVGQGTMVGTPASTAWPTANKAFLFPFRLSSPIIILNMFVMNGATAADNLDVGIYTEDFTLLVSSGSTAQAGTNAIQTLNITDTQLGAGVFYLAMAMDGTTGTVFRSATTGSRYLKCTGCCEKTTSFVLPATIAPGGMTTNGLIVFGATARSVV